MSEPMVKDIMADAVKDVTLDTFLDRLPRTIKFPEDYIIMLDKLRKERAMFIEAQEKKQAKKDGVEDIEDADSTE